jgi:hypothetical protein
MGTVHLIVPFAATSTADGQDALSRLATPALDALLAGWHEAGRDVGEDTSLTTPHERAWARALGWHVDGDGALPWAARLAAADGIDVGAAAWGLLTPVHWRVGSDAVHLADPHALSLGEAQSRALFDAVRPLFDSEGFTMAWGASLRWYGAHPDFAAFPTASLERVIGRNVERWLPTQAQAQLVRRLQSEVQMLLYTHPVNEQREAAGVPVVNSFWLSGCGAFRPGATLDVQVDDRLTAPALAGDWSAWTAAWTALDASLLPTRPLHKITLCGERSAVTFERNEQRLWQRLATALKGRLPTRERLLTL